MGQLGFPELLIIGIIAMLVFGPKKLPELGRGLGKAIHDFKSAMNEPPPEVKEELEPSSHAAKAGAENSPEIGGRDRPA
jgi:sec-independent protein translocase protein TatA